MSLSCTGNRLLSRNRDSVRIKAESGSEKGVKDEYCHMPASERIQCRFHAYRTCLSSNRAFPRGMDGGRFIDAPIGNRENAREEKRP